MCGSLFDGWTMVDPGLVPVHEWHPTGGETVAGHLLAGVGKLT